MSYFHKSKTTHANQTTQFCKIQNKKKVKKTTKLGCKEGFKLGDSVGVKVGAGVGKIKGSFVAQIETNKLTIVGTLLGSL